MEAGTRLLALWPMLQESARAMVNDLRRADQEMAREKAKLQSMVPGTALLLLNALRTHYDSARTTRPMQAAFFAKSLWLQGGQVLVLLNLSLSPPPLPISCPRAPCTEPLAGPEAEDSGEDGCPQELPHLQLGHDRA